MPNDFEKLAPLLNRLYPKSKPKAPEMVEVSPGIYRHKKPRKTPRIIREVQHIQEVANTIKGVLRGL